MKQQYNTLIVDDEPFAHTLLENYCEKLNFIEVVGNCYSGLEALNVLNQKDIDILLLDIQMPEITGIELLDAIQNRQTKVIMVTAYSNYAIDTYNYDAVVDYLLKPIKFVRFVKALERAKKAIANEKGNITQSIQTEHKPTDVDYFCLTEGKTVHKISYESLIYVQSYGNYVKLFLIDGEIKIIRNTISRIEMLLSDLHFCRIHKSYLLNLKYVNKASANKIQLGDVTLPLGSSYARYFKDKLIRSVK